tara:strand:+ start:44 stop:601 length:558 start_codon:yes stop_codon:yes gene_type:complete
MKDVFEKGWTSERVEQTVCGWGSEIEHTEQIRRLLPSILVSQNVKTFNDAGCGDLNWISTVDLGNVDYTGYDLVPRSKWNRPLKCLQMDISKNVMRKADMILCRDVFIHLPNETILEILDKFKQSSDLLLTTTFLDCESNEGRIQEASTTYSKLNLELEPFNLDNPIVCIAEDYPHKYTCLWRLK